MNPVRAIDGVIELPLDAVIFREDVYPRIEKNPATVQKYAEDLSVLPPIEVNQRNELIDGWNRWTAHRKREAPTIRAIVTQTERAQSSGNDEVQRIARLSLTHQDGATRERLPSDFVGEKLQRHRVDTAERRG